MKERLKISSRDNQKLKFARNVRDGKQLEYIFIEGIRLAEEALGSGLIIEECFVSDTFDAEGRKRNLLGDLESTDIPLIDVSDNIFPSITDTDSPQGIVMVAKRPTGTRSLIEAKAASGSNPHVIFLSEIRDPSNLGAIMRTADAAGIAGIITSTGSVDAFSPKSLRASMGAAFRLPVWEKAELDDVLTWSRSLGMISTAADIKADTAYTTIDWNKPCLLILGSEAHGLRDEDLKKVDKRMYIPMENDAESLNLAVACGIILFEARRQQFLSK